MSELIEPLRRPMAISGRKAVFAMFAFGITATATLFGYWTWHLMPFMPLQEAIVAEFPGSAPRVDGGQRKMRLQTPVILRVVMKTERDPFGKDVETATELDRIKSRIIELSQRHATLPALEFIELHLYRLLKEQEIVERGFRFDLARKLWQDIDGKGEVLRPESDPQSNSSDRHDAVADESTIQP